MSTVVILIGEEYYNKDPLSSELGRRMISASIELLDQLGFEEFTFKKLADHINSTEASVYRYFDNKLKVLVYLTSWYWAWMEHMIDYQTHHITDKEEKLKETLKILCHVDKGHLNMHLSDIDTLPLRRVVVSESDKTYLTKKVDKINNEGLFKGFKGLCHKIALMVSDICPSYKYPHTIVSSILEASNQQVFFAQHLPSLTEVTVNGDQSIEQQVYDFIHDTVFKLLK